MAKLIVGSSSFDMSTWNLADIASGAVTSDSATEVDVTGAGAFFDYTLSGTGFTTFDTNGFPTSGTVTSVTMVHPGRVPLTITGISISASDFMGFVNGNDPAGLEAAIFSGNDTFGGKAGNDTLLGFGGNDSFNMTKGGNDTVNGGDGNDTFTFGAAFTAADSVDGGAGTDKVALNGDYSAGVTFGAATMVNVESMTLVGKHSYNLTFNATSDTTGQSLDVTAANVTSGHSVTLDGSALAGTLRLVGSTGDDTLRGGAGSNTLNGGDGNDTIYAGTGDNHINAGHGVNTIHFSNWTSGDFAAGGTVFFDGDFSAGATILGSQLSAVSSVLTLAGGHEYNLTFGAGNPFSTIDGTTLGAGDTLDLTVDDAPATGLIIRGGTGNDADIVVNGAVATLFDMSFNNHVTLTGGSGDDIIDFSNNLTADDRIDGGGGNDVLGFGGESITFGADTIKNIHEIESGGATIVMNDANLAAGQTMIIAGASDFDGSAETDGTFLITEGSSTPCHVIGSAGDDTITVHDDGSDTLARGSIYDGGGGTNTLQITDAANEQIVFRLGADMVQNIATLDVTNLIIVSNDGNVAAGQTLDVVMAGGQFNGSAETDGSFNVTGVSDEVKGGAGDDTIALALDTHFHSNTVKFQGDGGSDILTLTDPASAHAEYDYLAVTDSTSTDYDTITHFSVTKDAFHLWFAVSGLDANIATGALSTASFDSDLAAAVGATQLGVHHALVYTPDSGSLAGQSFLIVDANGVAGYQAGQDLVIHIDSAATLNASDFLS
jgi:hypothetical protein